jgi:hypothetical protein
MSWSADSKGRVKPAAGLAVCGWSRTGALMFAKAGRAPSSP